MGYVDLNALKETLELQGETFADDDLKASIEAASKAVEDMCGRTFTKKTVDETRTYHPTRNGWLEVDDLISVTSIRSNPYGDETYSDWVTTDYELDPVNAVAFGAPHTSIRLSPYGEIRSFIPQYRGSVEVIGRFGWPEVPPNVQLATKILSARFLKRVREAPFGIAGIGVDGIAVRVSRTDPDVGMLLGSLKRSLRLA